MKTLRVFLLLTALNIAFIVAGFAFSMNDFPLFLLSGAGIVISVIIFIIAAIVFTRKSYLAKNNNERKRSRKLTYTILAVVSVILLIGWIILCFRVGYVIPGRDKHKDWKFFPEGNNPQVAIKAIDSIYIYTIENIKGTENYMLFFATDSVKFSDYNSSDRINFGIIDNKGNFKIRTNEDVSVYADREYIYVMTDSYGDDEPKTCERYDAKTLTMSTEDILPIPMPEQFDIYSDEAGKEAYKKAHQTDFFRTLTGIRSFDKDPIFEGSDKERGHILYKGNDNKLYRLADHEDSYSLRLLCDCTDYSKDVSEHIKEPEAPSVVMADEPNVSDNHFNGGFSIGFGNPTGGHTGPYFNIYQSWTFYYTATISKGVQTSFKVEGGNKNWPYQRFYQLNTTKSAGDTLYIVADSRIWKLYKK
jgi:heme/copper-type cytochrome/quinol oxidase subunit 2